ncbi:hypothetical protein K432DRAFT_408736 [Lepidopterella palustris CBS 459.81]|uniref:DH domain-containing protein n=1 Tax=Lepidopterella palustris CBS 459.81 TaxID=1314670 RepID=A0A8E2JB15_9PEZI|nr:hypothetical protein K432DRAFT_408736 [Lepidopterella palustris CBS 459.81]
MTTASRQRPNALNGATSKPPSSSRLGPTPRPGLRSVSSPAGSSLSTARSSPALPNANRPAVKSLVQKFDQPSNSTSTSSTTQRYRPSRNAPASKSSTSLPHDTSNTAFPQTTKEISYGSYKFNNLKPRERPQHAPVTSPNSRRTNVGRQSLGSQASTSRTGLSSAASSQNLHSSSARRPFFGEVVSEQDGTLVPGYGISDVANRRRGSDSSVHPTNGLTGHSRSLSNAEASQNLASTNLAVMPPDRTASASGHRRSRSDIPAEEYHKSSAGLVVPTPSQLLTDLTGQRKPSPPSKIPLPKRRPSVASDSGSSIRSTSRAGSALGNAAYNTTSPIREPRSQYRAAPGQENSPRNRPKSPPVTLSSRRYGSSPNKSSNSGNSLKAVIHAPPQQTSPRLRHSRERQPVSMASTSASRARSAGRPAATSREPRLEKPTTRKEIGGTGLKISERRALLEKASRDKLQGEERAASAAGNRSSRASNDKRPQSGLSSPIEAEHSQDEQLDDIVPTEPRLLTVNTLNLPAPSGAEPLTDNTEFEQDESPVLGMPGAFAMTPPITYTQHQEHSPIPVEEAQVAEPPQSSTPPENEVLSSQTFQRLDQGHRTILNEVMKLREQSPTGSSRTDFAEEHPSEIDDSESIQIMLSDTPTMGQGRPPWRAPPAPSQQISMGSQVWRVKPLDSSATISFLEEEESPIDPFDNRSSVRPDDSVSVAYRNHREDHTPSQWTPAMSMPESGRLTLDSEAYSTINRVLDMYHTSNFVTPEMAHTFQEQVRAVSPALAQHKDWDSKEATETYLARLLSDANGGPDIYTENLDVQEQQFDHQERDVDMQTQDIGRRFESRDVAGLEDSPDADYRGTAIIYTQPRRYSHDSAATSIWTGSPQGYHPDPEHPSNQSYRPTPPPKDLQGTPPSPSATQTLSVHRSHEQAEEDSLQLEGLGLAIHVTESEVSSGVHRPPLPSHSPPPPPSDDSPFTGEMGNVVPKPIKDAYAMFNDPYAQLGRPLASSSRRLQQHQRKNDDAARPVGEPPVNADESSSSPRVIHSPPSPSVYSRNPPSSVFPSGPPPPTTIMTDMGTQPLEVISGVVSEDNGAAYRNKSEDLVEPVVTMEPPQPLPPAAEREDSETKRLKKRRHIIKELLETESSYIQDLMVAEDIYRATSKGIDDITDEDRKILFGNMNEIIEFSKELMKSLKIAGGSVYQLAKPGEWKFRRESNGTTNSAAMDIATMSISAPPSLKDDLDTSIGVAFFRHMAKLERVYSEYTKNHGAANQRLMSLQTKRVVITWLQECSKYAHDLTSAWNLDALLIKPTQRFLKYPLLLQGLLDATPQSHDDYSALVSVVNEFRALSSRINESQKRAELVDKLINRKDEGSGVLLPFTKVLGRRTDKLKQQMGMAETVDDQGYDAVAQKFGGHFFQLQIVMRDVEKYIEDTQKYVDQQYSQVLAMVGVLDVGQTSHPEIESQWRKYAQVMQDISMIALPEHKAAIRKSVIEPILQLWKMHDVPQTMMQKRKKRIPEYVKYKSAKDRGEKIDKKTQELGEQWMALNDLLKTELPMLYAKTKKLIDSVMVSMINLQVTWHQTTSRKLRAVLEQEPEQTKSLSNDMAKYTQQFVSDHEVVSSEVLGLGICNKTTLTDISNFLSPAQTFITDDSASYKKSSSITNTKRTQSLSSEVSSPDPNQRLSGNITSWQTFDYTPPVDGPPQTSPMGRMRAGSALSSRGPSTPRSAHANTPATSSFPQQRPSTGAGRSTTDTGSIHGKTSLEMTQRTDSSLLNPSYSRSSGVFSSALPMSDTPTSADTPEDDPREEIPVMFVAASLFEFNIAHDRREGGYPYLVYVPGEIFDVIGLKGELWLARNQDDPCGLVGWIWEKHFARILPGDA